VEKTGNPLLFCTKLILFRSDGKALSSLSFQLKDAMPAGEAVPLVPLAAPAQLPPKGSVDVEAID
jgi:hypothetical protein